MTHAPRSAPPRIAAVLLDAGGTLLREQPSRYELYLAAARARGLDADAERVRALMHAAHAALPREIDGHFRYSEGWFRHFVERVFAAGLGLERARLDGLCAELFARFADPRTFALFPGARELLVSLRARGLAVGVVSNWSERLPGILDGLGIGALLDFSVVSAIERVEKPERAMFELALRRAGVTAERALHCGDDLERDVQGASALGILTVRVEHGGRGGAATVGDLFELERWIRERIERA